MAEDTSFLIIACDGIWDCLTSEEAVEFIGETLEEYADQKISIIIEEMFDKILANDTTSSEGMGCDNMTCVIV